MAKLATLICCKCVCVCVWYGLTIYLMVWSSTRTTAHSSACLLAHKQHSMCSSPMLWILFFIQILCMIRWYNLAVCVQITEFGLVVVMMVESLERVSILRSSWLLDWGSWFGAGWDWGIPNYMIFIDIRKTCLIADSLDEQVQVYFFARDLSAPARIWWGLRFDLIDLPQVLYIV